MGRTMYVLGLFFIASIISSFAAELSKYKNIQKSSLILEYNWPEPSKSLNRLPHPRSCHHFIHTKHDGRHVVKRCHGDKIFDYRSLRCQHKSSAKCWMNIVKKGNIKKIKRPFSCPFPWGLYPDKEDCTFFYSCMGGKVFPRKCPNSTLFDVVERICVHSRKALCARDSDIITPSDRSISELPNGIATVIPSKSSGTFDLDSKERNSEEVDKKNRKKSKNKFVASKLSFNSPSTELKSFRTTDSEEDSSGEKNSSEEKYRTKSKNKFLTSKLLLLSTSTVNPKLFKNTNSDFQENSSEEEENSSKEKNNKIRPKYELKLTTSKIQTSTNISHKKENTGGITPISTNMFTEKERITPTSMDSHSSESPFQSPAFVSTENKLKPLVNTMTPGVSDKDVDINGDTERVFWPTETTRP